MIDYLILTHNIEEAKAWWTKQQPNSIILTETEIALLNNTKFGRGFLDVTYSNKMIEELRIKSLSYKSTKVSAMIVDMRHQTAVEKIPHKISGLYYDFSLTKRIAYCPQYITQFTARNAVENLSDLVVDNS